MTYTGERDDGRVRHLALGMLVACSHHTEVATDAPRAVDAAPDVSLIDAASDLAITPTLVTFPATLVGQVTAPMSYTVTNHGAQTTGTLSAGVTNTLAYTTVSDECTSHTLAPGASCHVSELFNPTAPGTILAMVIASGSPGGETMAFVTGNALPVIAVAPPSFDFGNVAVGTTSAAHTFQLTNVGPVAFGPLDVTEADVVGPTSTFPITADTCQAATLAPGASCTLAMQFAPTDVDEGAVNLTVTGATVTMVTGESF
jgi:hypothetical protein